MDGLEVELANKVAAVVIQAYEKPKGLSVKPLKHFRNSRCKDEEYTLLAGIVAIRGGQMKEGKTKRKKVDTEVELLTLATGTKSVPARQLADGRVVHDMHAEILSIRLFNLLVLEEIAKKGESELFEVTESGRYKLRDNSTRLALYVSDIPCGDASIANVKAGVSNNKEDWEYNENELVRGRAFFGELGRVRTKPGRKDAPISYSKSCSDKLCLKQYTGLLSSVTYGLIDPDYRKQFYLEYLVVPQGKINSESVERCFHGRVKTLEGIPFHPLKVIGTTVSSSTYTLEIGSGLHAQDVCLTYVPRSGFVQVLNRGVRNGASAKKVMKSGRSEMCRERMIERLNELQPVKEKTYSSFKDSVIELRHIRDAVKQMLGDWTPAPQDDFVVD